MAILGEYVWIYGDGADGHLSLRLPRGKDKELANVTGECSFGGGGSEPWAMIMGITPTVDEQGKECWSVDVDEWIHDNGDGDEPKEAVKGHRLYVTAEKDDDGNAYVVWTFAGENWWLVGKKTWGTGRLRWDRGYMTEGDKRRLGVKEEDYSDWPNVLSRPPQKRTVKDLLAEKDKLGLGGLVCCSTYFRGDYYNVEQSG